MKFMVITKVKNVNYLTKVEADSAYGAEHLILDLTVCGHHDYGVESCMAFSDKDMKFDTFIYNAMDAEPISFDALRVAITEWNAEIQKRDAAEDRIREIERVIKDLNKEMDQMKDILSA